MTPEQWLQVKELFSEALERDPPERGDIVRRADADPAVRAEVLRLLDHEQVTHAAVDRPPAGVSAVRAALTGRSFAEGEVINRRYRIVRMLGEGGMGQVYEAHDTELDTPIAIKTLPPSLANDERVAARLLKEARLARQVTHPNVCRIFDAARRDDRGSPPIPFFTMEFVDGVPLSAKLRALGRAMTEEEALPIVRQICAALEAAHAAGVVHRDLKSGNVLLAGGQGGDVRAVVADFGLSRLTAPGGSSDTMTAAAVGTPAYMAPEQIEGKPTGPAADIYALGVILYEMVTGRQPYEDASVLALAAKKVSEDPPSPRKHAPRLDGLWEGVILRCLARNPEDRFPSARGVIEALEGGGLSSLTLRLPRIPKRRRFAAAALVLATLLTPVGLWLWSRSAYRPNAEASEWYRKGVEAIQENGFRTAANMLEKAVAADGGWPLARARLAEAYVELDTPGRARDELLRVAQAVPNRSRLARAERLRLEAAMASASLDWPAAEKAYEELARSGEDAFDLARIQSRAGRTDAALTTFGRVAAANPRRGAVHLHLGSLQARKGNMAAALESFGAAEKLFQDENKLEGVAETRMARALALESSKRIDDSIAELRSVVDLARNTGNERQRLRAELRIAFLTGLGDLAAGRRMADEALRDARRENISGQIVLGMNDLASLSSTHYKLKDAEELLSQAIQLAEQNGNGFALAASRNMLAQTLIRQKRMPEALPHLDAALAFYRESGSLEQVRNALLVRADAFIEAADFDRALEAGRGARRTAEERNDSVGVVQAEGKIGHVLLVRGEYPAAVESFRLRIREYGRLGRRPFVLSNTIGLAFPLAMLGRFEEARRTLAEAETMAKQLGGAGEHAAFRLNYARALVAHLDGNSADARRWGQRAVESARDSDRKALSPVEALMAVNACAVGDAPAGRALAAQAVSGAADPEARIQARFSAAYCARDRAAAESVLAESRVAGVRWWSVQALALLAGLDGGDGRGREFEAEYGRFAASWTEAERERMLRGPVLGRLRSIRR